MHQNVKIKPYSIGFREKVVKAYEQGNTSIRKLATRFEVSKAFVQRMLKQKKIEGHVKPGKQGGSIKSELEGQETQRRFDGGKIPRRNIVRIL